MVESATPEAFAVEAHIPVGEVVEYECRDCTRRTGWLVVVELLGHGLYESVEQRENPPVDFGALCQRYFRCFGVEAVDVGIHGEEVVSICECGEILTSSLFYAFGIVFEVVPRRRGRYHVPAQWVGARFLDGLEGIDGVAFTLRHFLTFFVEHEAV